MPTRCILAAALLVVGAGLVVGRRPLAALLLRLQPRWMHPWPGAPRLIRALLLVLGLGAVLDAALWCVGL